MTPRTYHGIDAHLSCGGAVCLGAQDADGQLRPGSDRQAEGAGETLVLVGVVVAEGNLHPSAPRSYADAVVSSGVELHHLPYDSSV